MTCFNFLIHRFNTLLSSTGKVSCGDVVIARTGLHLIRPSCGVWFWVLRFSTASCGGLRCPVVVCGFQADPYSHSESISTVFDSAIPLLPMTVFRVLSLINEYDRVWLRLRVELGFIGFRLPVLERCGSMPAAGTVYTTFLKIYSKTQGSLILLRAAGFPYFGSWFREFRSSGRSACMRNNMTPFCDVI